MNQSILNKQKLTTLLPYLGIFFVLLMGSGLIKIPPGSPWFYVIKFSIIIGVLGIGVWTWYKAKTNNQPPTAYLQLALFVPFTIDFHLHYAFIFLTIILFNKKLLLPWNSPLKPIYLLFIWGFISYIINQFIEFNPLSFPLFVVTFFLPFIYYGLFTFYRPTININSLINHFYIIIIILSSIIIAQTIFFWNLSPDLRTGGTQSAHYAAIFLSIAFIFSIFGLQSKSNKTLIETYLNHTLLIISLPIIFLIDAKYILSFLIISVLFSLLIFGIQKMQYQIISAAVIILFAALWLSYSNKDLPLSQLALRTNSFNLDGIVNYFPKTAKGRLVNDAIILPKMDPTVFLFGSGPGTFLSRAANSRTPLDGRRSITTINGGQQRINSKLPGEIPEFTSWIKKKYGQSFFEGKDYGGALFDYRSSLINIYFEFGIIGFVLFTGFFINIILKTYLTLKEETSTSVIIPVFSLVLFLFLISFIELWYEQPAFQILSYSMLPLFLNGNISERFLRSKN